MLEIYPQGPTCRFYLDLDVVVALSLRCRYCCDRECQKNKEIFDISKLPIEDFAASLGLPMTPKVRFIGQKKCEKGLAEVTHLQENGLKDGLEVGQRKGDVIGNSKEEKEEDDILVPKETSVDVDINEAAVLTTRLLKKKKLKINIHRPAGTRLKYDDDGNVIPPLASFADIESEHGVLQPEKVMARYKKLREEMKPRDEEDKVLHRKRMREKRTKEKIKQKRLREDDEDIDTELDEASEKGQSKKSKIYFDSDDDDNDNMARTKNGGSVADSASLAEQEALALKLLSSMHS